MRDYLPLLHENPADLADLSPADMKAIIERYTAWSRERAAVGGLVSGPISPRTAAGRSRRHAA